MVNNVTQKNLPGDLKVSNFLGIEETPVQDFGNLGHVILRIRKSQVVQHELHLRQVGTGTVLCAIVHGGDNGPCMLQGLQDPSYWFCHIARNGAAISPPTIVVDPANRVHKFIQVLIGH